ncbi:MAG: TPR end-of-group domain-containing protein, partial [Candidatus Acidiferrales bacterium]
AVPVELMKDAAEKYGYIVAGSNNSRNGPFAPSYESAAAMAEDLSGRFPVDAKRVYFTGFSGGARASVYVTLACGTCAAGVILHGAGLPSDRPPNKEMNFAVFSAVGTVDFNYSEVVTLQEKLADQGITHRLRRFEGPHQWAPAEVWMEAVEWIELIAMKQGRRTRDEVFIRDQLSRRTARAREREAAGELFVAWQEYRDIARDFEGLVNVSEAADQAATLDRHEQTQEARRDEQREFEQERAVLREFNISFGKFLNEPVERPVMRAEIEAQLRELRRRRESDNEGSRARVAQRAFTQVTARLYEAGEHSLREKDYPLATMEFDLLTKALPDQPGPQYQLARAHALGGKKKDAIGALREALKLGFNRPALLEREDFAALRDNADFQRILETVRKSAPGSP